MAADIAKFWDKEVTQPTHNSWMAPLRTRLYINELVSGRPGGWPLDWFEEWLGGRRLHRALSVGCGTGPLERDLVKRNICGSIDAFDSSEVSLDIAQREAIAAGVADRIHYSVADFNEPSLPRRVYDAVFFHQSAHHVGKLEKLFRAVLGATKPGAVVYLDEFIGPSRTDWPLADFTRWQEIYQRMPREARSFDHLPLPIHPYDPSEAIRSSEILEQLQIGFDVQVVRGYGGNVLSVLFAGLIPAEITDDMVAEMIETEKRWLADGQPHFHAIIVATRRDGLLERAIAHTRYFAEPKLKRLGRELKRLARR